MAVSLALQIIGGLIAAFLALVWVHRDRAWGARAPLPRYGTAADPRKTWPVGPPASMPFLGNQPQMSANADRYLDNFLEWRQKYGLGYEITIPGYRMIECNHPAWLEHFQKTSFTKYGKAHLRATNGQLQRTGVFTSDGHIWSIQRKAATHAFSRNHFKGPISEKLSEHINVLVGLLDNLCLTGEVFDFQDVMGRFTMLFSCSIAFSTHSVINDLLTTDPQCLRKRSAFVDAFDNASPLIDARTRNSLWRITEIFDKSAKKAIDDCVDAVYAFIDPLVKERLEEVKPGVNDKNGDLLDLMLTQSRDAWTLSGWMINFLFAGRDTTAYTITWQLYEMLNPANASKQMLSKARDEIEEQGLGERGSYLDYDNQKDLRYVTALWQETTRIHPASARGVTLCYEDDVLPAIPEINQPAVQVKKGDLVHWQDWVMNRLPEIWGDDCLEFKPERWLTEAGTLKPVSLWTWHSFNAGPRTCLGKNLATFDALSVFSAILPRYEFQLETPDFKPKYTTGMNMGIEQGLHMRVKRRVV